MLKDMVAWKFFTAFLTSGSTSVRNDIELKIFGDQNQITFFL